MKNTIKELEQLLKIQRSLTRLGLKKNIELENRITDLTKPAQPMVLPNNFGKAFMGYVECFGGNLLAVYCKDTILSVLQKKDNQGKMRPVSKLVPVKVSNAILNNPRFS